MVLESEVGLVCLFFLLYKALFQEQNYEASGSSVGVVPPNIVRGRGSVEGNAIAYVGGFVGGHGSSVGVVSPSNVGGYGSVDGKASVSVGGNVGGHGSSVGVVSPNIVGGHGKVEGKASVSVGGIVGGQGSSVGVVPPNIVAGHGSVEGKVSVSVGGIVGGRGSSVGVVPPTIVGGSGSVESKASVSVGGIVGGHVEGRACVTVGGRDLNGASGGTAVVTGSLGRPARERLGNMVHFNDYKAETKKVGDLTFVFTCYVMLFIVGICNSATLAAIFTIHCNPTRFYRGV